MSLRDIRKEYRDVSVTALDGVSFDVRPGEVHALVGENGAGKSTLARIMCGFELADGGSLSVAGSKLVFRSHRDAERAGIAFVPQYSMLAPGLSAADNLALGHEPRRFGMFVDPRLVSYNFLMLCDRYGLDIPPDVPVGELSFPEQREVEILRALARGGRLLVLDEPTSILDDAGSRRLAGLVRRLAASGTGIVYISHRVREIIDLADRVSVLRAGRLVDTVNASHLDECLLADMIVGDPFCRTDSADSADDAAADAPGRVAAAHPGPAAGKVAAAAHPGPSVASPGRADADAAIAPGRADAAATGRVAASLPGPAAASDASGPGDVKLPVLEMRGVSVHGRGAATLESIDLDVHAGEIVTVVSLGSNGLDVLEDVAVGIRAPDSGSVKVNLPESARSVAGPASGAGRTGRARVLAYLPTDRDGRGLCGRMSTGINAVAHRLRTYTAPEWFGGTVPVQDAGALLGGVGIREWQRRSVATLSGGNRQRVVIARELDGHASLVIAANAAQGLDAGARRLLAQRLAAMRDAGSAVLVLTSDPADTVGLPDRSYALYRGKLAPTSLDVALSGALTGVSDESDMPPPDMPDVSDMPPPDVPPPENKPGTTPVVPS